MTTKTAQRLTAQNLGPAVEALRRGDVVAIPTETVYGLAGNAFDSNAVAKIFSVKERPSFDPLIVHIPPELNSVSKLAHAGIVDEQKMTPNMKNSFEALAVAFWPGPLTMILPKQKKISDLVTSGLDRVGVRMPAHPLAQEILRETGLPLAAPSANRFGRISPTTADHVLDELGDRIPFVIDGGACEVGVESTVVALDHDKVWLLRPGKISATELSRIVSLPVERAPNIHEKASPGMLASHYAPRKTFYIVDDLKSVSQYINNLSFDLLVTAGEPEAALKILANAGLKPNRTEAISKSSNPAEAAKNLFAAMRTLDRSTGKVMIATPTPSEDGLWLAIADRLNRASKKA